MNADTDTAHPTDVWLKEADIELPAGLMGFAEVRNLELIHNTEELPFRWLNPPISGGCDEESLPLRTFWSEL